MRTCFSSQSRKLWWWRSWRRGVWPLRCSSISVQLNFYIFWFASFLHLLIHPLFLILNTRWRSRGGCWASSWPPSCRPWSSTSSATCPTTSRSSSSRGSSRPTSPCCSWSPPYSSAWVRACPRRPTSRWSTFGSSSTCSNPSSTLSSRLTLSPWGRPSKIRFSESS